LTALNPASLFAELGGSTDAGFSHMHTPVYHTPEGTPYLTRPGVVMLARPQTSLAGLAGFLSGYDESNHFSEYLDDPTMLPDGSQLCKIAGQLCYMSFGRKRSFNAQAERYFTNLKESGHGSVFEHANFSLLLYGISRSVTHELVRHRAGLGFSQQSQRYVSGRMVRFVERPEYALDKELHTQFLERIERAARDYASITERILTMQQQGTQLLSAEVRTDLRKKVQQTARSVLPNETEAPIVVTGNARAWRHVISMRASAHAETEIRELAVRVFLCLAQADPMLFSDYSLDELPDGTYAVSTAFEKI
jgi:thymidylate synthase (FAD)